MFHIDITDEQALLEVDHDRLRQIALGLLQTEGVRAADISIALVDDARIHEVNREFLQHDYPTDVISFLLDCDGESADTVPRGKGLTLEGEVVLSTQTAIAESAAFGWNPADECCLYLVHGLLHLCGYDDLSESELAIMRAREAEILNRFGLQPHYARKNA